MMHNMQPIMCKLYSRSYITTNTPDLVYNSMRVCMPVRVPMQRVYGYHLVLNVN